MDKLSVPVDQIEILTKLIENNGKGNVQDSVFIYATLTTIALVIVLVFFLMNMLTKQLKKQQEQNQKIVDDFSSAFKGIDEAVKGIYNLVLGEKELGEKEFAMIVPHILKNTILSIQFELMAIVDRNNLIYSIDDIKKDIVVLIDTKVNDGRLKIQSFQFEKECFRWFVEGSNTIVDMSKNICVDLFVNAANSLQEIEDNKESIDDGAFICKMYEDRKKRVYQHLKRGLYSAAQELGHKMELMVQKGANQ